MRLAEMECRFHELEGIIAKAKQQVVQQDEEVGSHWPSGPAQAFLWLRKH